MGILTPQSLTVFGLVYLPNIQLMPCIARWKDLKIYKFSGESYPRMNPMFTVDNINADLIAKRQVNEVISKRIVKKQQMRSTKKALTE